MQSLRDPLAHARVARLEPGLSTVVDKSQLQAYLRQAIHPEVELLSVQGLGEEEHDTGISTLLLLELRDGGDIKRLILRRPAPTVYSTDQPSDRAHTVLQAYELYPHIPRHPRSLDVAVLRADGGLSSVPADSEFVLLQEYADGALYLHSLMRCLERDEPNELEDRRAVALAKYLTSLHAHTRDDPRLYRRSVRDIVAGGVGAMGVIGGYSKELRDAFRDQLDDILRNFIGLAWRLDRYPNRLCRIHGDLHPLNILFGEDVDFSLIDASGTGWGDAAFDFGIMLMNYYALYNERGGLSSPSGRRLTQHFLNAYVADCEDVEGLYRVLPLSMARGALIMATTDFFPHRPMDERERLIELASKILRAGVFTPSLLDG